MKRLLSLALLLILIFTLASCTVKLDDDYRLGGEVSEVTEIDVYLVESVDGSALDIRDADTPVYTIEGGQRRMNLLPSC